MRQSPKHCPIMQKKQKSPAPEIFFIIRKILNMSGQFTFTEYTSSHST